MIEYQSTENAQNMSQVRHQLADAVNNNDDYIVMTSIYFYCLLLLTGLYNSKICFWNVPLIDHTCKRVRIMKIKNKSKKNIVIASYTALRV